MILFRHRKSGRIYRLLAHGIDETVARCGLGVVIYCPLDDECAIFVREDRDFEMRFEMLTPDEVERMSV